MKLDQRHSFLITQSVFNPYVFNCVASEINQHFNHDKYGYLCLVIRLDLNFFQKAIFDKVN